VDIKSNVEADLKPRPQVAAAPKPPARPVPAADISLPAQVEEALDAAVRQAAPAVEVPEPAEQPEPVAAEADTVAAEAEPVEVAEAEELVEEPVAVSAEQAEAIPVAEQEPAAEVEETEPVEVEEEEEQPAPVPEPVFELEPLPEPAAPVLGRTSSLRDVPDDVWSLRRRRSEPEPGRIRFAEDIVGLRGGPPSRRDRDSGRNNRRTKAGKRRRR
jgi:hypothetical protein